MVAIGLGLDIDLEGLSGHAVTCILSDHTESLDEVYRIQVPGQYVNINYVYS